MILSGSEASKSAVSTWNECGTASSLQTSSIRRTSERREPLSTSWDQDASSTGIFPVVLKRCASLALQAA